MNTKIEGLSSLLNDLLSVDLNSSERKSPPREPVPSPTKSVVKWKFGKPVFPLIIVKRRPMKDGEKLIELHCGCKCEECIQNYKAYWTEKTYSEEIKAAMNAEKEVRKEVFAEIKNMERNHEKQLQDLRASLEVCDDKRRQLSESLEFERTLRSEEMYRREVQNQETSALLDERIKLESQLLQRDEENIRLRNESEILKESARAALALKDKALMKLREFEVQANRMDRDNSECRVRLHAAEIELSKLRFKNDALKEKLNSVRPHEMLPAHSRMGSRGREKVGAPDASTFDYSHDFPATQNKPRQSSSLISRQAPPSALSSVLSSTLKSQKQIVPPLASFRQRSGNSNYGVAEQASVSALSSITALW